MAPTQRKTGSPSVVAVDRVTVNLTPRGARALEEAVALTGDNKTDTVNRALQFYNMVEQVVSAGGDVLLRRSPDAEPELVRII